MLIQCLQTQFPQINLQLMCLHILQLYTGTMESPMLQCWLKHKYFLTMDPLKYCITTSIWHNYQLITHKLINQAHYTNYMDTAWLPLFSTNFLWLPFKFPLSFKHEMPQEQINSEWHIHEHQISKKTHLHWIQQLYLTMKVKLSSLQWKKCKI
jgi:hypothetical protein